MEIPDQLRCLFSAQVTEQEESYQVEIPEQELQLGTLSENETYRVAVFETAADTESETDAEMDGEMDAGSEPEPSESPDRDHPEPPVEEGETQTVEIESLGDQGDGIARVDRGFVVIVPDTEQGERVRIEIVDVKQTVAFGDVVERLSYYD